MKNNDMVVGVDGSVPSWDALHWALREAYRWRARLRVVIVDQGNGTAASRSSDSRLAQMVTDARRLEPSVRITGHVGQGDVVPALREASHGSRMLVVGGRGRGGFGRLLVGSTSQQVAEYATVPVAVVRGRHGAEQSPIVVGVDGTAGAEAALGVALDEARLRRCTVIAIFAYGQPVHPWLTDGCPAPSDPQLLHASAYMALESAVTPWREKFPRVSLESVTTAKSPVPVLTDLSSHAQLVVVGAHGHDHSTGPLGSVPGKLLHRAHCPVLIVR